MAQNMTNLLLTYVDATDQCLFVMLSNNLFNNVFCIFKDLSACV